MNWATLIKNKRFVKKIQITFFYYLILQLVQVKLFEKKSDIKNFKSTNQNNQKNKVLHSRTK